MAQDHALKLGKLLGNLQSLETLIRLYLLTIAGKQRGTGFRTSYWNLAVGNVVPEDEFTNYDSLDRLIARFNADVTLRDSGLIVDASVVAIRDLLAHGRISADAEDERRLAILKFDKPIGGKVTVAACALMDDAWFATSIHLIIDQVGKVHTAVERYAT